MFALRYLDTTRINNVNENFEVFFDNEHKNGNQISSYSLWEI